MKTDPYYQHLIAADSMCLSMLLQAVGSVCQRCAGRA